MTASGIATVARHELRLRVRAGRWRRLLLAWFLVLLAFTALLRSGVEATGDYTEHRSVMYGGLMLFLLALALLVAPALAAQSVNGDRERGILATLQVTRLSATEIALGKFAAAWGTSLVFLAASAPLVIWCMSEGGVGLGRVLVVTMLLAVLLGTVVAIALALSAVLSRSTTSSVLSYLAVFALTVGTLVAFGLATALAAEEVKGRSCGTAPDGRTECHDYSYGRTRTDRTWVLLAPNPFVVLADAAPRQQRNDVGEVTITLDPLGVLGEAVRTLREPPADLATDAVSPEAALERPAAQPEVESRPVWPLGLAVNLAVAVGALALTARRLRTPSRDLARGQRIA